MNILLCTQKFQDARRVLLDVLKDHNCIECAPSEIFEHLPSADVVIPFATPFGPREIKAGRFGLLQQFGVGIERIDVGAATEAGVWVCNVPGALFGNADSVAEHAIMLMLALSRRLNFVRQDIRERRVNEPAGFALLHKTCCLVGLGDIGVEMARRLLPFGMRLTAVRRQPRLPVYADLRFDAIYGIDELPQAVEGADYVVLMLPQTPETHHIVNAEVLARMKPGAFIVNVGRGALIDHDALHDALKSGHIAGAGLDVFWEEPVDPDHPIFEQNVIATPHVAGVTDSSVDGIAASVVENIQRHEVGQTPRNAVNTLNVPARRREPHE